MKYTDLSVQTKWHARDTKQGIVVIKDVADLPGGCTLDVEGFEEDLQAGHIIVVDTQTGDYKPLGVEEGEYKKLGATERYFGVLKRDTYLRDADGAITVIGTVNAAASPYPITDEIRKGLPAIVFLYEEKR